MGRTGIARQLRWPPSRQALLILLAGAIGAASGVGLYTFQYAEGLSYLSADPKACVNCHIMIPQYQGWQRASHHAVAGCVDCHLPNEFVAKYLAKAESGFRHSKEFTAQTFAEPIKLHPRGAEILQRNCIRCHGDMVAEIADAALGEGSPRCVHCHQTVGHGERAAIGGPMRQGEIEALQRLTEEM